MSQSMKQILFLCTGNYYRSRFAECLFNSVAAERSLSWRASSRALAVERGFRNVGPMAATAVKLLQGMGIVDEACTRMPMQASAEDFAAADLIVALMQTEHEPLVAERFPTWGPRVEYWQIPDAPNVLCDVERAVRELAARLAGPEAANGA